MRLSGACAAAVAAAAIAIGGCGGDSGVGVVTKPRPAKQSAAVHRSLADARSPAATVVRFWESIRDGALPLSLSLYDPRSVASVGLATFAGMLSEQREAVKDSDINVLRVERVAGGELVGAEGVPKLGSKVRLSFFLRRNRGARGGRWRITYDTLSATGLPSFVQSQTQRSVDPNAAPGRKALAAGDEVARAYRAAALEGVSAPPATPPPTTTTP